MSNKKNRKNRDLGEALVRIIADHADVVYFKHPIVKDDKIYRLKYRLRISNSEYYTDANGVTRILPRWKTKKLPIPQNEVVVLHSHEVVWVGNYARPDFFERANATLQEHGENRLIKDIAARQLKKEMYEAKKIQDQDAERTGD